MTFSVTDPPVAGSWWPQSQMFSLQWWRVAACQIDSMLTSVGQRGRVVWEGGPVALLLGMTLTGWQGSHYPHASRFTSVASVLPIRCHLMQLYPSFKPRPHRGVTMSWWNKSHSLRKCWLWEVHTWPPLPRPSQHWGILHPCFLPSFTSNGWASLDSRERRKHALPFQSVTKCRCNFRKDVQIRCIAVK